MDSVYRKVKGDKNGNSRKEVLANACITDLVFCQPYLATRAPEEGCTVFRNKKKLPSSTVWAEQCLGHLLLVLSEETEIIENIFSQALPLPEISLYTSSRTVLYFGGQLL